jgi:hypothetical protein
VNGAVANCDRNMVDWKNDANTSTPSMISANSREKQRHQRRDTFRGASLLVYRSHGQPYNARPTINSIQFLADEVLKWPNV